jgi:iron(III) transport system permease protein
VRISCQDSVFTSRIRMVLSSRWPLLLLAVCTLLWIVGPALVTIVYASFRGPAGLLPFESGGFFTLTNVKNMYASGTLATIILDTLRYSVGASILACIVATALAWLVSQTRTPFRGFLIASIVAPVMVPPIITSIAWVQLLSPHQGFLNVIIRNCLFLPIDSGPVNVFSMYGMILVQGIGLVPILFLVVYSSFRNMDHEMEEASYAAGAGIITTFWRVTLPMLRPSILAAFFVALIFSMESFEVPVLLGLSAGVQVLGTYIYNGLYPVGGGIPQYGQVSAVGLHFLLVSYVIFLAYTAATRNSDRFGMLVGRRASSGLNERRHRHFFISIPVLVYLLIVSAAPIVLMLWLSFSHGYSLPSMEAASQLTLDNYRSVISGGQLPRAILNTLIVAVGAASLTTIVSAILAWAVVRRHFWGVFGQTVDLIASSSIAIPTVVAATAFFVFYMALPIPLYGTIFVLILVYSYRTTIAFRIIRAGTTQIHKELEDASYVLGGSWVKTFQRITFPLLRPSLMSAWLLLMVVAMREFTIPLIMTAGGDPLMVAVLIWQLQQTSLGEAMAAGSITIGVIMIIGLTGYLTFRPHRLSER